MRNALAVLLLVGGPVGLAIGQPIDLRVAVYPYLPDPESALERFEKAFEEYAATEGVEIDLDLELIDTYDAGSLESIVQFDVAEIDLCMFDLLRRSDGFALDLIPTQVILGQEVDWVGPAQAVMGSEVASYVLPHWVCGNFLVTWTADSRLEQADGFDEVLAALDPKEGRYVLADLWGGVTLGEFYADAVLDIYGPDELRHHLLELAETPQSEVPAKLRADAVLALWRLTLKMKFQHRAERAALHHVRHVYPETFSSERDSALIGYSERLHYTEREMMERPWEANEQPIPVETITVRQIPFGTESQGTPSWVDAFVVPRGRLSEKREAVILFLRFAMSDEGYHCFLEPRQYYPGAYLLPARRSVYDSEFVRKSMPLLREYRQAFVSPFPVVKHQLYIGIDKAGESLKSVLEHVR